LGIFDLGLDLVEVLEIRRSSGRQGFAMFLLAKDRTIAVGWFSRGDVDGSLIDLIAERLVERLTGDRLHPTPPVAR